MNTCESYQHKVTMGLAESEVLKLNKAVQCYMDRKERTEHPQGQFDNGGRWYPSEHEACTCCEYIRSPSRGFPFSLMVHCRTVSHVAQLFGVGKSELRKSVNEYKRLLDKAEHTVVKNQ